MDLTWTGESTGSIEFTKNLGGAVISETGGFVVESDEEGGTVSLDTRGTGMIEGFEVATFVESTTFSLQVGGDCW